MPGVELAVFTVGKVTVQAAALQLRLGECRVLQLCRTGTLHAVHVSLPGRSPHRLRWLIEEASVGQLVAARFARPPATSPRQGWPVLDPATVAGTLSVKSAAEQIGIRADTIYGLLRSGTLRGAVHHLPAWNGTKPILRVSEASVEQHLARRSLPPPPRAPKPKKPRTILPDPWQGSDTVSVREAATMLSRAVSSVFALCSAGKLGKRLFPRTAGAKTATTVRVPLVSIHALLAKFEADAQLRATPRARAVQTLRATPRRKADAATALPKEAVAQPGKTSPFPAGYLPLRQAAEATGETPSILLRLFRARFIRGGVTVAGKVLIELASVPEHVAATRDRNFWTPARTRRYLEAGKPPRPTRDTAA